MTFSAPPRDRAADDLFRVAEAVGLRGVDQIDARVDARAKGFDGKVVVDRSAARPAVAAHAPGAEADDGTHKIALSEFPINHDSSPFTYQIIFSADLPRVNSLFSV